MRNPVIFYNQRDQTAASVNTKTAEALIANNRPSGIHFIFAVLGHNSL